MAATNLDHLPRQPGKKLPPILVLGPTIHPHVSTRKPGMVNVLPIFLRHQQMMTAVYPA